MQTIAKRLMSKYRKPETAQSAGKPAFPLAVEKLEDRTLPTGSGLLLQLFEPGFSPVLVTGSNGQVSFSGTYGTFNNVSIGTSKPVLGSPSEPVIDLGTTIISTATGGTLTVTLADTDYTVAGGASQFTANAEATGEFRGAPTDSLTIQSWVNSNNLSPLDSNTGPPTIPAGSVATYPGNGVTVNPASSTSLSSFGDLKGSATFPGGGGPFSIFEQVTTTFAGAGGFVNPDFSTVVTPNLSLNTVAGGTVVIGSGAPLSDTAVLSGGNNPTGTITFNLFAPGVTPAADNSNSIYTDVVAVNGNGNYSTDNLGTLANGNVPTTPGTYIWQATYSGDANNHSVSDNGQNESETVSSSPQLSTQGNESPNGVVGTAVLSDTATLSGGYMVGAGSPPPTITFNLIAPNGATVYTETQTVTGTGNYTTTGTGTGSELATQVGTYHWDVTYSGNSFNSSVTHGGSTDTAEQLTTVKTAPQLSTQGTETANGVVGTAVLSDTATLSGGYMVAAGNPAPTITFTLIAPNGSTVYTETQTVTGAGNYTTTGTGTGSELATQVGLYYWNVSYNANGSPYDTSVSHGGQNDTHEQLTTTKTSPGIVTTPGQYSVTTGTGTFATIGFWHNQNGQALITRLGGGLGTSLAGTYPHLFGAANVYGGVNLTGLSSAQVAADYLGLWKPSGLQKNTYVQSFAVALGLYAGGGAGTFNVGGNGALFGVANNTTVPITQILQAADAAFSPSTGLFYGGDSTKTSALNGILDGINTSGETPGGPTVVATTTKLTDSATLSGGFGETGTLTFYLMGPGSTASTPLTSAVYTDVVTVNGDGTYGVQSAGNNSGGYMPTANGTYQWVVVYSGDGNNGTVTSPFGAEPWTAGPQSPAIIATTPNMTAVTLGTGAVVLKDTATLADGNSPTGTITFTLVYNNATVYTQTVTVAGNGDYTTTGYTLPTTGTVTGTYQWNAVYSGDTNNNGDSEINSPAERTVVSPAGPSISTTPGGSVVFGSGAKLSDSATLSGGYNPTGTVTFSLYNPSNVVVYTDVVTVSGNGSYTTAMGTNPGGYLPTMTGTYQWVAVYSGDGNTASVTSPSGSEPETVGTSTPPPLGKGMTATIGFWKNRGQQVITSIPGTSLGNWLATNWPNLFAGFAGQSSTFVATAFQNGATNTYLQAFAIALDVYFDTTSLGGSTIVGNGLAAKYGFRVTSSGGGNATWNIGGDGAALGAANNSNLTLFQILAAANQNYNPTTGQFYGGNATLTDQLNTTLNGINERNDIALTAGDASSGAAGSVLIGYKSDLHVGAITVAVDALQGTAAAAEHARIDDAIASLNASLAADGVTLVDVGTDNNDSAAIHIHLADTSVIGGAAQGVLGVTEFGGDITLITGWNYYLGSDPAAIGAGQYDFETVVAHELGHAIGLGHSTDTGSVMFPYLDTTQVRRQLTTSDLAAIDAVENGPEPLLAAGSGTPVGPATPQVAGQTVGQTVYGVPGVAGHDAPLPGVLGTSTSQVVSATGVTTDPLFLARSAGASSADSSYQVSPTGSDPQVDTDPTDAMLGVWVG
jgi:hypothetical protein